MTKKYNSKITLKADFLLVEGEIGNLDRWRKNSLMVRADLLKDWVGLLQQEYERTVIEGRKEMKERQKLAQKKRSIPNVFYGIFGKSKD